MWRNETEDLFQGPKWKKCWTKKESNDRYSMMIEFFSDLNKDNEIFWLNYDTTCPAVEMRIGFGL